MKWNRGDCEAEEELCIGDSSADEIESDGEGGTVIGYSISLCVD